MQEQHTRESITALFTEKYGHCDYVDETHTYTLGEKVLTSVTTKKKEVIEEFASEEIATKYAHRRGLNKDDVLALWASIAETSAGCGVMLHELLEACLTNGQILRPTDHSKYSALAHARFHAYKMRGIPAMMLKALADRGLVVIACELKVWCKDYAGTIDLLAWDELFNCFRVVDWKTNSKGMLSEATPWTTKLHAPFGAWDNGKIEEYSVQLESYGAILDAVGIHCGVGLLIHGWFDIADNYCDAWSTEAGMRPICAKWLGLE